MDKVIKEIQESQCESNTWQERILSLDPSWTKPVGWERKKKREREKRERKKVEREAPHSL